MHVRNDIAVQFGIPKSGTTHVDSNQIVSDGYKVEDIDAKLTPEAIQEYVGVINSDMEVVWDMMIDKVQGIEPKEEIVEPGVVSEPIVENPLTVEEIHQNIDVVIEEVREEAHRQLNQEQAPKKRGRPAKQ